MEKSPKYHPNLFEVNQLSLRTEHWPGVFESWQQGHHHDCLLKLIDCINPSLRKLYGNEQQTDFEIPHGSVLVKISIKGNSLGISSVYVSASGAVLHSLFRKVTELNFYPLHLAQIHVSEGLVRFHYTTFIDLCNPCKIYQVLKEICDTADRYESEFHQQLLAKKVFEPQLIHWTENEIAQCHTAIQHIIKETLLLANYFETQELLSNTLKVLTLALMRIEFIVDPGGFLKRQINEALNEIAQQATTTSRIDFLRSFLLRLQQVPLDEFKHGCWRSQIFILDKTNLNLQGVKDHLKCFNPEEFMAGQNYIHVVTECLSAFYSLTYGNYVDKALYENISTTLANSSEKPWDEAAHILMSAFKRYQTIKSPVEQLNREFTIDCVCSGAPGQHLATFKEGRLHCSQNSLNPELLNHIKIFCEQALADLGLNPAKCRDGNLSWKLSFTSVEGGLFVYQEDYLYATASLSKLHEDNIEFLNEIATLNIPPFMLGVRENEVFLSYRIALCELFSTHAREIRSNVSNLYNEANNLASYFANKYGQSPKT